MNKAFQRAKSRKGVYRLSIEIPLGKIEIKKITINLKIRSIFALILLFCLLSNSSLVYASGTNVPYDTYNFDYRKYTIRTPAAYLPEKTISGTSLGIDAFLNPQDICMDEEGNVYVADTGNHRIVVMNADMNQVVKIITSFENEGKTDTFNAPYGVCVSEKNLLYIADSENKRIVVLNDKDQLVKIIDKPTSEILADDFVFTPLKITVDYADRVYCIAKGMFEGIMMFEDNGTFTGFFGTIKVKITLWEKIWKRLSTKEQRKKQLLYVPTEFTGADVDLGGFVYASNIDTEGVQAVRRLNPKGEDVIKKGKNENLGGDIFIGGITRYSGPSYIVDVVYRENGIYSLLDSRRGRIFTYDHEGNLLYIFGGLGTQSGTFTLPVAIESTKDRMIVLDSYRAELISFQASEYGSLINEAVGLRFDGNEKEAVELWERVLQIDENFELAYIGIGKAYLTAGNNKMALEYLKKGMDRQYYSIAYKRYRNAILKDNLGYVFTGAIVLLITYQVVVRIKRKKHGKKDYEEGLG